jgi:hypothetical protein
VLHDTAAQQTIGGYAGPPGAYRSGTAGGQTTSDQLDQLRIIQYSIYRIKQIVLEQGSLQGQREVEEPGLAGNGADHIVLDYIEYDTIYQAKPNAALAAFREFAEENQANPLICHAFAPPMAVNQGAEARVLQQPLAMETGWKICFAVISRRPDGATTLSTATTMDSSITGRGQFVAGNAKLSFTYFQPNNTRTPAKEIGRTNSG